MRPRSGIGYVTSTSQRSHTTQDIPNFLNSVAFLLD